MLGRLEMDVNSCIQSYIRMCEIIFSDKKKFAVNLRGNIRARFKTEPLEEAIKSVITKQGLPEDELLKNPDSRCKVYRGPNLRLQELTSIRFVCATSGNTSAPFLFRSYPSLVARLVCITRQRYGKLPVPHQPPLHFSSRFKLDLQIGYSATAERALTIL